MDLNHISGELAGPRHDDLTREKFAGRILAALESVQSETERRTLERAIGTPVLTGHSHGTVELALYISGVDAKCDAIRALLPQGDDLEIPKFLRRKEPAPDPLLAALAGLFKNLWNAGSDIPVHPYDWATQAGLLDAITEPTGEGYAITELGRAAIAEDGR